MTYLDALLGSRLPLPAAVVVAIWPLLFLINHLIARALRALSTRQSGVAVHNRAELGRSTQPLWVLAQVLFAASVFTFALYAGGAMFVFLGGGLVVSLSCIVGLNVQALLSTYALTRPGACKGTTEYSARYALRQMAGRMFGTALTCALLGALLAHLALFGAALLCASGAVGLARRALQYA